MDRISREELLSLTAAGVGPRVSIYLPIDRGYPAARQNPARLRTAVARAEHRLRDYGHPLPEDADLASLLAPARGLVEQEEFWRGCGAESIAVLLAPGESRVYLLPFASGESVDVARDYRLAPLVRFAGWPVEYYLLALSLNSARLFYGSPVGLSPVVLPGGMPESLTAFLAGVDRERAVRFQAQVGAGTPRPYFHGGTSHVDDAEIRREEYVHAVAAAVAARTARIGDVPLVLAASEELHPIFRAAYPGQNLVAPGLLGCPDHVGDAELRDKAARLVEGRPDGPLEAARQRFRAADGKKGSAIETVLPAATEGRVETLILVFDHRVWGEWDAASGEVRVVAVASEGPPKSEDLTEAALRETLRHGGKAFVVPQDEVPEEGPLAAVLRW